MIGGRPIPHLTDTERALVSHVEKLTRQPASIGSADVAALRALGMSDRAIFDATAIAGFFAYVNRIALGLGVPLEAQWRGLLRPAP